MFRKNCYIECKDGNWSAFLSTEKRSIHCIYVLYIQNIQYVLYIIQR